MTSDLPTSLTLLQRARAQDPEAWRRLVDLYSPLIDYWCRQGGIGGSDVEDLRQEILQAVAGSLKGFQRDRPGDTFRGWLRGIARHKILDHFRRNHFPKACGGTDALRALNQVADGAAAEADDPPEQLSALYHRALELVRSEFEERTWQAFWRAAIDGHAPADIAADMGITSAGVRKAKSRVLRRLKEEVGDIVPP